MDVKEAVQIAQEYLTELYESEQITNVGLEEIVFDDTSNSWKITIGFSRPWDHKNNLVGTLGDGLPERSYKVVSINGDSGKVESLVDRVLKPSA